MRDIVNAARRSDFATNDLSPIPSDSDGRLPMMPKHRGTIMAISAFRGVRSGWCAGRGVLRAGAVGDAGQRRMLWLRRSLAVRARKVRSAAVAPRLNVNRRLFAFIDLHAGRKAGFAAPPSSSFCEEVRDPMRFRSVCCPRSPTMEKGNLSKWMKSEGDKVKGRL